MNEEKAKEKTRQLVERLGEAGADLTQANLSYIQSGFEKNLSEDQVKVYANHKYNERQMTEIQDGFVHGLTMEQVSLYANPKFDRSQMFEIRDGFEHGLTMEQVAVYASTRYNDYQMFQIRDGFEHGLTMEQVAVYASTRYSGYQMFEIRLGLEDGLTMEQVALFADPKYNHGQMFQIRYGLKTGLTNEQIALFSDPKYNRDQMHQIRYDLENGLTMEQVKLYADPEYDIEQMQMAGDGFRCEQTLEQVSLYIGPGLSLEASRIILDFLTDPDIRQNLGLMGMTARVDKDHNITIQYKGKEYSCPANDIPYLVSGSKGIGQIECFGAMIKYEAAKGRDFDPVRDREDAQNVNTIFHELGEDVFNVNNDKTLAEIAKEVLLGEHYFCDNPTYSKDYFNRLTDAFKKHCHGFVPKIIETVAMIGEHTGQDPDEIAKHFNVRALKQLLNRTNDWAQAFLGSQMSVEDRNKFIIHPDRNTITGMYYKGDEKNKTASQWYLNHPTASRDLIKDIMRNIESISLTPDMRTEDVEKQIILSGAERDIKDIENKYGIDLDHMGYNVRHSYTVNHNNGQVARTLLKGEETEMVSLGEFTCCCQEFGEAGETAMMYGLIHPEAGFWVIEDDRGKVLAQAEIWEPYKDHDTIVFDNIEFADDRDISTVMDTLVQWCENSRYKNVIMGTGYNEIDYDKFPEAPINHPVLSKEEVKILDKDNEDWDEEEEETGTWEGDTYFVQDRDNPYLYSDALDKCVYLKHDGQIPQEVLDQCSDRYGKDAPVSDKQERYEQVDGELHDKYELAAGEQDTDDRDTGDEEEDWDDNM